MLTLEVLIDQVFRPDRGDLHDPKRYRLAKFVFIDKSKLRDIIILLNSISVNKIDFYEIGAKHPRYLDIRIGKKTTIQVGIDTRDILNELKLHPRETYEDVLNRLLYELSMESK